LGVSSTQLTGLSDSLRHHSIHTAANGSVTTTTSSFNPATKELTTTTQTDSATPFIQKSKYGLITDTISLSERVKTYYDAFLTPWRIERFHPVTNFRLERIDYIFDSRYWDPVLSEHFLTAANSPPTFTRYLYKNILGLDAYRVDALGNAVETVTDVLGRPVASLGDTYPTAQSYDTAGRLTALATTRHDTLQAEDQLLDFTDDPSTPGNLLNLTRWSYDPSTGLPLQKTYANNTAIQYTHTPVGQPLRTTWARGA